MRTIQQPMRAQDSHTNCQITTRLCYMNVYASNNERLGKMAMKNYAKYPSLPFIYNYFLFISQIMMRALSS